MTTTKPIYSIVVKLACGGLMTRSVTTDEMGALARAEDWLVNIGNAQSVRVLNQDSKLIATF